MTKFRYILISTLRGIHPKEPEEGMCVYVDKSKGISAHLVRNADDYLIHLDTHRALAGMVLEGLANSEKFSEHFSTYLDLTRKNRETNNTGDCFLIIMKEGAASLDISSVQRPMENLAYGFELGDKETICSEIANYQRILRCALFSVSHNYIDYGEVGDVYYLFENDCTYYSFHPKFGKVSGYVSRVADAEIIVRATKIGEPAGKTLNSISRALQGALDRSLSEFQRFILAWSTLEIFTSKAYDHFKRMMLTSSGHIVNAQAEADLHDILIKKFERNLNHAERFRVLGAMLCSWDWSNDWTEFKRLKEIRDDISHGKDIQIDDAHVKAAATLLQKYLFAYVEKFGI